jgi:hypothetical protein
MSILNRDGMMEQVNIFVEGSNFCSMVTSLMCKILFYSGDFFFPAYAE